MNGNDELREIHIAMYITEMIFFALCVLKTFRLIDWSWWWVFSPLYAEFVGVCIVAVISVLSKN